MAGVCLVQGAEKNGTHSLSKALSTGYQPFSRRRDFAVHFNQAKRFRVPEFVITYRPCDCLNTAPKFAVIISKKVSKKAVKRNYSRRCLRECYRLAQTHRYNLDIIVIVRPESRDIKYPAYQAHWTRLIQYFNNKAFTL